MKHRRRLKIIALYLGITGILQTSHGAAADNVQTQPMGDFFVVRAAMRQVSLTGYTRARYVMDIVSEEAGRCVRVVADVGDQIKKDGLFAVLDTTFIDLSLKKNRVEQERLKSLIAYNGKEVRRYEELVERETAAQSTLDSLQNKLDQAQFQIQALQVQEAELKERQSRHHIRVPPGWSIIERTVEPGEWVSVGSSLGKAGDFRILIVPFSMSPAEYSALKKLNNKVELVFPDLDEKPLAVEASLERISPAFDPETRKINLELTISGNLPEKRGGLRTELSLEIPDPSGAVLVPSSAVAERYEEFWLTRVNGDRVRVLFLGDGPDNTYRVRSPELRPGDRLKAKP
jgi:RND family efflux transporter MFP subunit